MNNKIQKTSDNLKCIGPSYPPNTLFYHPQTGEAFKSNNVVCPVNIYNKNNVKFNISNKINHDFLNMEIEKSFIPDNYNEFLTKIYNINSFYDSNTFLSNNSNLNYISKSRIINSIYKVYKSNPEFPSDLFCSNIKDILVNYHNINIDSSKIKRKIIINKDKKNWANILDFFITNYKNN